MACTGPACLHTRDLMGLLTRAFCCALTACIDMLKGTQHVFIDRYHDWQSHVLLSTVSVCCVFWCSATLETVQCNKMLDCVIAFNVL